VVGVTLDSCPPFDGRDLLVGLGRLYFGVVWEVVCCMVVKLASGVGRWIVIGQGRDGVFGWCGVSWFVAWYRRAVGTGRCCGIVTA